MEDIKIYPIRVGSSIGDQSIMTFRVGMGNQITVSFGCFYIEADARKIMLDTGPSSGEHANRWHKETGPHILPNHESFIQLEKKIGVHPEEIDTILLTHLHWDHAYHMEKYPKAKIYVARDELNFALNPIPPFYYIYEHWQAGLTPFFLSSMNRMVQLDMAPYKITEHVTAIPLPGHSPGHMGAIVETGSGPYVLAGDAIVSRQNLMPLPERKLPFRMPGLFMDFQAQWRSIEKIMEIVKGDSTRVLANHDPESFRKDVYPDPQMKK